MRYEFFRALSALRFKSALSAYEPTMLFSTFHVTLTFIIQFSKISDTLTYVFL